MARLLIERETIYQDEVDMIMEGKSASEIIKIMEEKDELYRENPFVKMEQTADKKREERNAEEKSETVETTAPAVEEKPERASSGVSMPLRISIVSADKAIMSERTLPITNITIVKPKTISVVIISLYWFSI